jgi:hypothetical protein
MTEKLLTSPALEYPCWSTRQRKACSYMQQPSTNMTFSDALLKAKQRIQWRDATDGYQPERDSIHQLVRKCKVSIYRLRTGLCRLHQHRRKLGPNSCMRMWAQRPNTWTHSADLLHDKSTALLAIANDPQDQALGHQRTTGGEPPILYGYNVTVW